MAQLSPMPAIKLVPFFGKATNVFGYAHGGNKKKMSDEFAKEIEALEGGWLDDAEKVKASGSDKSSAQQIKKELKEVAAEKSANSMSAARVKALASAAAKLKKQEMDFK